jgi:signal transduction histidine kinase
MNPHELKDHLTAIQANDYSAEGVDVPTMMEAMVAHIGDPDSDFRELFIYPTLARWIPKVLSGEEKRALLHQLLDEHHLFYRIGDGESDAVFTRTFTLLALAILLYDHREAPFLSREEVQHTLEKVVAYANAEQDRRGYIAVTGWAHSMAHLADVLDELALCEEFGAAELRRILQTIQQTMTTPLTAYHHEEDERMAFATLSLFGRGVLSEAECADWLAGLPAGVPPRQEFTIEGYRQRVNLKHYLRSLYLQATRKGVLEGLHPAMLAAEGKVTLFT